MLNFLNNLGWPELLIIGLIIILFFGGSKLNEWARGLGEAKKEVEKIKKEVGDLKDGPNSEGGDK